MKTFDDIHVNRPNLAESYLALLKAQPGRPIALFAPRRIGKTYFLKNDLTPIAKQAEFLTIYADLWLNRGMPLEAINYALEEILDDVTVPLVLLEKLLKLLLREWLAFNLVRNQNGDHYPINQN